MNFLIILVVICLSFNGEAHAAYRKTCYYTNWSQYRDATGKFLPNDIDPTLCTQIVYAFCKIDEKGEVAAVEWNDESFLYGEFSKLKSKNKDVELLLAVGGWNHDLNAMSQMLSTETTRSKFVKSAVDYVKKHNFDGFDLDFEWPGRAPSPPSDKQKYTELVKELRIALNKENLGLSIAIPAGIENIEIGFEIKIISENVDFITIMSYDYYGGWSPVVGHHSALFPSSPSDQLNADTTVKYLLQTGVAAVKLNLGIPAYGRGFILTNQANHDIGSAHLGPNPAGEHTKETGFMAYYEILKYLTNEQTKVYRPCDIQTPYMVYNNLWMGMDDEISCENKVDYIKRYGLGGWTVWSLDLDDFKALYGKAWPLLAALNKIDDPNFRNQFVCGENASFSIGASEATKPASISTSKVNAGSTTSKSFSTETYNCLDHNPCNAANVADNKLFFPHEDPTKYVQCAPPLQCFIMSCPTNLVWNQEKGYCDYPAKLSV